MPGLEFKKIFKRFDSSWVLQDISFQVTSNEFVVLLGPSGCGKTTLLRIVAGLEDPDSGEILLNGSSINALPPQRRDVAMVFQNYALYPHMTVAQNLEFGLRMKRASNNEIAIRVNDVAGVLGIKNLLARKPSQLSGGQKQRVAMGRAMVRSPKVFLFDEPLSNLDASLRMHMRTEIKRLHQQLGITTLYVTHDQIEAMTLASKIVLINDGVIQQVGTSHEVYHKPSNIFVAGFIGSPAMNFIHLVGSDEMRSWLGERLKGMNADRILVGVRPEDLRIVPPGSEGNWKSMELDVQVVEPLGSRVQLTGMVGNQEVVALIPEGSFDGREGTVKLWFDLDRVHLFDSQTGKRLEI